MERTLFFLGGGGGGGEGEGQKDDLINSYGYSEK